MILGAPTYLNALHGPPVTLHFFILQLVNLGSLLLLCIIQDWVIHIVINFRELYDNH